MFSMSLSRRTFWSYKKRTACSARPDSNCKRHQSDQPTPDPEARPKMPSAELFPPSLGDVLSPLMPTAPIPLQGIAVAEIDAPGNVAYFTKGAMKTLRNWKTQDAKQTLVKADL